MQRRRLGTAGLQVTELCLGTMTFGNQCDGATSEQILDAAMDAGLCFIDSADNYPVGGTPDMIGLSESIIGRWIHARGNRERVLLATKCCAPTHAGLNGQGLSRQHIIEAAEASLRRLQTDHIDLYQAHVPDPGTPIEETLRAFDDLQRSGKVRYVGCSNYPSWRLGEALAAAERLGVAGYVSVQSRYNLLYREIETELLPLCRARGLGVTVYNPLAGGFLSGKYQLDADPGEDTRFTFGSTAIRYRQRYWDEAQFAAVQALKAVTDARGLDLVSVAVGWVLRQPGVSSAIVGASRPEQLGASLAAADVDFDEELVDACDAVWWSLPRRPVEPGYR